MNDRGRSVAVRSVARLFEEENGEEWRQVASDADWRALQRILVQVRSDWILKKRDAMLIAVGELDTFLKRFVVGDCPDIVRSNVPSILVELAADGDSALRGYAVSCLNSLTAHVPDFLKVLRVEDIVRAVKVNIEAGESVVFCWLGSMMLRDEDVIPVICENVSLDEIFDAGVQCLVENRSKYVGSFFYRLLTVIEINDEMVEKATMIFFYYLKDLAVPLDVLSGVHLLLSYPSIPDEKKEEICSTLMLDSSLSRIIEAIRNVEYRKKNGDWVKQGVLVFVIVTDLVSLEMPVGFELLPVSFDLVLFASENLDRTKDGNSYRLQMILALKSLIQLKNPDILREICVWNESRVVRELLQILNDGSYDVKHAATKCLFYLLLNISMDDLLSLMRVEVVSSLTDVCSVDIDLYTSCIRRFMDCSRAFGQDLTSILIESEVSDKLLHACDDSEISEELQTFLSDLENFLNGVTN